MARVAAQDSKNRFALYQSPITAIANPVELVVAADLPHCFAGVEFFQDAAGATPATPTAGTVAIDVNPAVLADGVYEAAPDSPLTADTPGAVGFDCNARKVKATPTGVSGGSVSHYRLNVSQNVS